MEDGARVSCFSTAIRPIQARRSKLCMVYCGSVYVHRKKQVERSDAPGYKSKGRWVSSSKFCQGFLLYFTS